MKSNDIFSRNNLQITIRHHTIAIVYKRLSLVVIVHGDISQWCMFHHDAIFQGFYV